MGKQQDQAHEILGKHIRKHVTNGYSSRAFSKPSSHRHKVRLLALQHFGTHHTRQTRPMRDSDTHGNAPETFAERVRNQNEQDDVRNAHHKVDEPGHRGIDALSPQGGRRSEHHGDD